MMIIEVVKNKIKAICIWMTTIHLIKKNLVLLLKVKYLWEKFSHLQSRNSGQTTSLL